MQSATKNQKDEMQSTSSDESQWLGKIFKSTNEDCVTCGAPPEVIEEEGHQCECGELFKDKEECEYHNGYCERCGYLYCK